MSKALQFYVIGEYVNSVKYCRWKGLVPYKTAPIYCNGIETQHKRVIQYAKKGYIYDILYPEQCFSGYIETLVRLPAPSYEELLNIAMVSQYHSERAGAVGILLKEYSTQFYEYLSDVNVIDDRNINKRHKRLLLHITKFVKPLVGYQHNLERFYILCDKKIKCFN